MGETMPPDALLAVEVVETFDVVVFELVVAVLAFKLDPAVVGAAVMSRLDAEEPIGGLDTGDDKLVKLVMRRAAAAGLSATLACEGFRLDETKLMKAEFPINVGLNEAVCVPECVPAKMFVNDNPER